MELLNDFPVSKNFNLREFACPCGCETVRLHPGVVRLLQALRDRLGRPVVVTSGYRCPRHNQEVGGASHSYHLLGMAADVYVEGMAPQEVAQAAEGLGCRGIGIYTDFVHLDIRPTEGRW